MKYNNVDLEKYASAVSVDVGFSQIASTWTRIGNMQQSASILLTMQTFIITIIFTYLTSTDFSNYQFHLKLFIFVFAFFSIFYSVVAFVFLLKILAPKKTLGLASASRYNELILKQAYQQIGNDSLPESDIQAVVNVITIELVSKVNSSIENVVDKNQISYSYCLNSSIISFFSSLVLIVFCSSIIVGFTYNIDTIFIIFLLIILVIFILTVKLVVNNIKE